LRQLRGPHTRWISCAAWAYVDPCGMGEQLAELAGQDVGAGPRRSRRLHAPRRRRSGTRRRRARATRWTGRGRVQLRVWRFPSDEGGYVPRPRPGPMDSAGRSGRSHLAKPCHEVPRFCSPTGSRPCPGKRFGPHATGAGAASQARAFIYARTSGLEIDASDQFRLVEAIRAAGSAESQPADCHRD
jgi:hypothetical protein